MEQLLAVLYSGSPVTIGVVVAVLVGLLTIVYFLSSAGRRKLGKNVLLVGICDAGKTVLFSKLVYKQPKQTQTSMKENIGTAVLDTPQVKSSFSVVDLPGHERLRYQLLEKYRTTARAVAFVIDSSTVQKEIKDVAEYLYNILTDEVFTQAYPPVLIICNKQDLTLSKSQKVIESLLEKELNNLRITQTAALGGTEGADNDKSRRRLPTAKQGGGDFQFAHLAPWRITFCECSAKGEDGAEEPSMEAVFDWLSTLG